MAKNFWESECTGVTPDSSANQRCWRCNLREYLPAKKDIKEFNSIVEALEALPPPGFGVGVYADEDNEEDVPRNAEMFEAASILSAMQVLMFSLCLPVIVCMCVYLTRFVWYYVCVSRWFCV